MPPLFLIFRFQTKYPLRKCNDHTLVSHLQLKHTSTINIKPLNSTTELIFCRFFLKHARPITFTSAANQAIQIWKKNNASIFAKNITQNACNQQLRIKIVKLQSGAYLSCRLESKTAIRQFFVVWPEARLQADPPCLHLIFKKYQQIVQNGPTMTLRLAWPMHRNKTESQYRQQFPFLFDVSMQQSSGISDSPAHFQWAATKPPRVEFFHFKKSSKTANSWFLLISSLS